MSLSVGNEIVIESKSGSLRLVVKGIASLAGDTVLAVTEAGKNDLVYVIYSEDPSGKVSVKNIPQDKYPIVHEIFAYLRGIQ